MTAHHPNMAASWETNDMVNWEALERNEKGGGGGGGEKYLKDKLVKETFDWKYKLEANNMQHKHWDGAWNKRQTGATAKTDQVKKNDSGWNFELNAVKTTWMFTNLSLMFSAFLWILSAAKWFSSISRLANCSTALIFSSLASMVVMKASCRLMAFSAACTVFCTAATEHW